MLKLIFAGFLAGALIITPIAVAAFVVVLAIIGIKHLIQRNK